MSNFHERWRFKVSGLSVARLWTAAMIIFERSFRTRVVGFSSSEPYLRLFCRTTWIAETILPPFWAIRDRGLASNDLSSTYRIITDKNSSQFKSCTFIVTPLTSTVSILTWAEKVVSYQIANTAWKSTSVFWLHNGNCAVLFVWQEWEWEVQRKSIRLWIIVLL